MIRLEHLSKTFDEAGRPRPVLQDVTASFAGGEVVAIRGRSGSGKTTLLNLIAGIETPSSGEIYVDDLRLTGLRPRQRTLFRRDNIGIVFQFFNLIPMLSVFENVLLPAELAGADGKTSAERAEMLLDRVGLLDRKREFPDRLSGGEQQRVAIARAMVRDPRLVLADEPTGSLDRSSGDAILSLLEALTHEAGKTLIVVTHSYRVADMADRTLSVEDGRLVPAENPQR
ncbi:MAG TPA: ABC transporter ATP-binding protein [Anaerolineales bacterium]|nr:ABC transporter ATP-binding protein [Anaerolineales bacterium]